MLEIQRAIKRIIERYIANIRTNSEAVDADDTIITLTSARRFECGDELAIYEPNNEAAGGFVRTIDEIIDKHSIRINESLDVSFAAETLNVQKLLGFDAGSQSFMKGIFLGDPAVISRFPAITVDAKNRTAEWLTLDSVREKYEIDITVYVLAADFEQQYELMHHYVKCIESSLFRSFYPLVEPYNTTTLAEAVESGDCLMKITDEELLKCRGGWFFLEDFDHLEPNGVIDYLGHGIYEVTSNFRNSFDVEDTVVIEPRRHIFNSLPASTQYGTVMKGTMLKAARISYFCEEERLVHVPYVDPLTY